MFRFLQEKVRALTDAAVAPSPELREASDPATPPERLREIVSKYHWQYHKAPKGVVAAIAANPNTPPGVLALLAGEATTEFLANPALPLAILESPDFVVGIQHDVLLTLCVRLDVPPVLLAAISAYPRGYQAATAARLNIVLAGEAPPGTGLGEARTALAGLVPGNPWLLQELKDFDLVPFWAAEIVQDAITHLPAEPDGDYRARRRSRAKVRRPLALYGAAAEQRWQERHAPFTHWPNNEGLRMGAAQDSRTPPELLVQLAEQGSNAVRLNIARNPTAPPEALRHLAPPEQTPGTLLSRTLAAHPQTPADVLNVLAKSLSGHVRAHIAAHPSCPEKVLVRLAVDDFCPVRRAARHALLAQNTGFTRNSSLFEEALSKAVQASLNEHPGTLTRFLAVHSSGRVTRQKSAVESLSWQDRLAIALRSEVTAADQAKLIEDAARPVRAVARDRFSEAVKQDA